MTKKQRELYTAQELELLLGKKYFYRQNLYRLAEDGAINSYYIGKVLFLSSEETTDIILKKLARRIRTRIPAYYTRNLRLSYKEENKQIKMYGYGQTEIVVDTDKETEEDFLKKIDEKRREVTNMPDIPVDDPAEHGHPHHRPHHKPPHHGPGPHHAPPPHHEVLEALRRVEDALRRIEDKIS